MKKFNPCLSILMAVLLLMPMSMFAQSFKVSGTVSDKNGAVIGASVLVKGTTTGASTNLDGHYTITVPRSESVLVFSFLGYKTREISVTSSMSTLNVTLEEDSQSLEDVVVLGFGASARRSDLSTSVGVVGNLEENKNRPVSSVENLLQGQVAGVTVIADGGDPTSTPKVTIRGMGSQSDEKVLWVVDGVPGAPFSINDIESMVVLKDAASAAIYGAQSGAAGVVLVTTKKAKSGEPSVTYEGNFGVRSAYNKPQSLTVDQQRQVRTTAMAAAGGSPISELWSSPEMSQTRTDWVDAIFRNAFYQRHQVAVSGGTDKFASRVAFNYNDDQGTLLETYNKKMSVRFNGTYDISRHITISEDATWTHNKQRGQSTGINTDEGFTGVIWSAMSMPRSARAFYDDGSYGGTSERSSAESIAGLHGDLVNPIRLLKANTTLNKTQSFSTTTQLNIHSIVTGLKFNSRFTYRAENFFYKNFSPKISEPGKPTGTNRLDYETYSDAFWETENTLTYDNTFGKHTIGALAATTASQQRRRGFSAIGRFFDSEDEADQYLSYASDFMNPSDSYTNPDNNVAIVARLSYSFDNRYFVTASWRRDYAGRLPKGHKSGDFPAVTGAWKISSEPFFKQNDVVTLLKLRASWGRIGNLGAVPYAYSYATLSRDGNGDGTQVGGGVNTNLLYAGTAINPRLSWETSEQTDIGLDMDMFKGRLTLSGDFFMKRTYDLIQAKTIESPDYIGVKAMTVNLGEIRNRGFEFSASWKEQVNKNWSYFAGANIATIKNWVSDIGATTADGSKGVWTHNDHFRNVLKPFQTPEGQPLYSYYLYKTDGLFQSDEEAAAYIDTKTGKPIQGNAKAGDIKFVDTNNDGKIDSNDRQYMGSYQPKLTYSFSAGFSWKDLSFSMMWQGAAKTKAFNATKYTYLNEGVGVFNRSVDILKAWPATNEVPRLTSNDQNNNFEYASDFYLEDASYLRLKNVTISYDLTRLIRKSARLAAHGSSLSVFVSGENLWTITNYSGLDPEVGGKGLDAGRYPVSRVFSVGLKLTY